jgi:glycosyltransferase involved in cell wall biosynthesis
VECVYNLDGQVYPFVSPENHVLTPKVAGNLYEKVVFLFQRIYRLWKLKRKLKPDYCISQLESSDYLNILTRQRGEKTICLIQCSMIFNRDISGISGWWRKNLLMPVTYRKADAIVPVSPAIQLEFEKYFHVSGKKIFPIYNFIDLEQVRQKSRETLEPWLDALLDQHYCFITAGRLTAQKNQMPLISVFAELKRRTGIPLKLLILGDGELRDPLILFAKEKGLTVYSAWDNPDPAIEHDVYFLGFNKNPFRYFARSKWFIFPSLWEGLPLVLVEAMASGVPIISADCPTGPADILNDGFSSLDFITQPVDAPYGVLMPMIPDIHAETIIDVWCSKILTLYKQDEIRKKYIVKLPQRVKQFSTEFAIAQWIKILKNI